MIYYKRCLWSNLCSAPLAQQILTFRDALIIAGLSTVVSLTLCIWVAYKPELRSVLEVEGAGYASFTTVLGFLTVFRTSQASSRFWEGCGLLHGMMGDWFDAVSTVVSFCKFSKADPAVVHASTQLLVRLMSLLNAMILGELEACKPGDKRAHGFELLDLHSIDTASISSLAQVNNRPEVVFQWVQGLIVTMIQTDVLCVPPPLLTRIFQDLGNGMSKYHQGLKFPDVPVPFPYVAMSEMSLYAHAFMTPVVSIGWSAT